MFSLPEKIQAVSHPLIEAMYVKHEQGGADVLIIETNFSAEKTDGEVYSSYMTELLFDLENLKEIAEEKIGHIDRVDIRTLH